LLPLTAVVAVALLGFGALSLGALSSESAAEGNGHPADTTPRNTADPIPFDETAEWLGKLRTKANVSFVQSGVGRADQAQDKVVQKLTTLGPLNPEDRAAVEPLLASLVSLHQGSLLRFQRTMSSASIRDALEEAGLLLDVEVALAAQARLLTGDYIVLATGQEVPPIPDTLRLVMGVHFEGKPANACFLFPLADNPGLRSLRDYRDAVESAWIDDVVTRFNSKPMDERADLIRRRDAFVASPNTSTPQDLAVMREWFPPQLHIDPQSYLLVRM